MKQGTGQKGTSHLNGTFCFLPNLPNPTKNIGTSIFDFRVVPMCGIIVHLREESITVFKYWYQRTETIILELAGCLIHVLYINKNFLIAIFYDSK